MHSLCFLFWQPIYYYCPMTSSSLISTVDLLDRKQPQEATIAQWGITSVYSLKLGKCTITCHALEY